MVRKRRYTILEKHLQGVKLGIVDALDVIYENGIVNADVKWSEIRERAALKKDEMYDTIGK